MSKVRSSSTACYAKGGPVLGKVSDFMKSEDASEDENEFTEADTTKGSDEDWGKGGDGQVKGPSNPKPSNKQAKLARRG